MIIEVKFSLRTSTWDFDQALRHIAEEILPWCHDEDSHIISKYKLDIKDFPEFRDLANACNFKIKVLEW